MKLEKIKCDYCKKEAIDIYEISGWIQVSSNSGSFIVGVYNGRDANRAGQTKTYYPDLQQLDFCCATCLLKWMKIK